MEVIEEYVIPTFHTIRENIPPSVYLQIASYAAIANEYFQYLRFVYAEPYIINPVNTLINSPPDLYSILILFFILVISLKVLDYARRVITFWIVLFLRLLFWSAILGGGYYVYKVGWGKASQDAAWILGLIEGFIQQLLSESDTSTRSRNGPGYKRTGQGRRLNSGQRG
ncbi:hypothetical protein D8B26_007390 [Coccidioides posadasii str. Silveira]|uniref:Uncharacterized protein n=2 Tax=Coccidioides posadasii TaxID=199306 RepID=E9CUT0_COCPS|nr:conserved hypothetical protein [Coccidioides posadasii str. Silveira]KMM71583.1 hypothetical protein CPAG_07886 [Coccidioides posadasii RMSCC 3488]QVM12774.1 hypothetical protein D8B26_007390 [Coccidioides posadasii str. Silveira]